MQDPVTADLWIASGVCGLVCLALVWRKLGTLLALSIVALRVGLALVYFDSFYDGSWTFLDDFTYHEQGERLLAAGFNPFTVLFDQYGLEQLQAEIGSSHFLYGWFNLLAQYLFGPHYFSAVFLNIILSFLSGLVLVQLLAECGWPQKYCRRVLVFFLLHVELLAWCSFINLKDVLVMALTVLSLLYLVRCFQRITVWRVAAAALIMFSFFFLRYYLVLMFLAALTIHALLLTRHWQRFLIAPVLILLFLYVFPWQHSELEYVVFDNRFFGIARFLLTPRPWGIADEKSFLFLPAIFNWLFFIPLLIGAVSVWRRGKHERLLVIYLGFLVLLYASVPELQGPRHRVQLLFIIAWLQFQGIAALLRGRAVRQKMTIMTGDNNC